MALFISLVVLLPILFVIFIFCVGIMNARRGRNAIDDIKKFLNHENNVKYFQRGVQFLLKEGVVVQNRSHMVLEILLGEPMMPPHIQTSYNQYVQEEQFLPNVPTNPPAHIYVMDTYPKTQPTTMYPK
jgi:hypothetical protein